MTNTPGLLRTMAVGFNVAKKPLWRESALKAADYVESLEAELARFKDGRNIAEVENHKLRCELALARKVCDAVRAVKAAHFGPMFWQCDAGPLEDLDDAFAAYDAATQK